MDRAEKIVDIIEDLEGPAASLSNLIINRLNIIGLIPIKGDPTEFEGKNLLSESIDYLKECKLISDIFVSTDNDKTAQLAQKMGAKSPFIRPPELSLPTVGLPEVLKFSITEIEKLRKVDLVVIIEENYPFRPKTLIENLIYNIIEGGYDTVCASIVEERSIWLDRSNDITPLGDKSMGSRNIKTERIHINLFGLGAVTYVDNIRKAQILTNKLGLSPVSNYPYSFQIQSKGSKNE